MCNTMTLELQCSVHVGEVHCMQQLRALQANIGVHYRQQQWAMKKTMEIGKICMNDDTHDERRTT